ncbi:hypothetical protein PR048_017668 [Dryococelus australis]|uniref:Uncharacterized protein n=1 Tax=Dryococelus australis TaxID=614101 RepID=A0ABQ9HA89_9NEOP|nr:hypothetical protein PR048_017668 [Dryococelus australis]
MGQNPCETKAPQKYHGPYRIHNILGPSTIVVEINKRVSTWSILKISNSPIYRINARMCVTGKLPLMWGRREWGCCCLHSTQCRHPQEHTFTRRTVEYISKNFHRISNMKRPLPWLTPCRCTNLPLPAMLTCGTTRLAQPRKVPFAKMLTNYGRQYSSCWNYTKDKLFLAGSTTTTGLDRPLHCNFASRTDRLTQPIPRTVQPHVSGEGTWMFLRGGGGLLWLAAARVAQRRAEARCRATSASRAIVLDNTFRGIEREVRKGL